MDYLNMPPNGFEPQGWNTTGTASNLVVKIGGWDTTKGSGNMGIGDGSLATLGSMSNKNVNFTDHYILGGDVSTQPWDPGRIENVLDKSVNITAGNAEIIKETTEQDNINDDRFYHGGYSPGFYAYHPIFIGRPVNDMMYEDPFGISISTYGRLMGLMMPDGSMANIGIRCLGYGY